MDQNKKDELRDFFVANPSICLDIHGGFIPPDAFVAAVEHVVREENWPSMGLIDANKPFVFTTSLGEYKVFDIQKNPPPPHQFDACKSICAFKPSLHPMNREEVEIIRSEKPDCFASDGYDTVFWVNGAPQGFLRWYRRIRYAQTGEEEIVLRKESEFKPYVGSNLSAHSRVILKL